MKRRKYDNYTEFLRKQAPAFKKAMTIEFESMLNSYGGTVDEEGRWKKNLGQTKR